MDTVNSGVARGKALGLTASDIGNNEDRSVQEVLGFSLHCTCSNADESVASWAHQVLAQCEAAVTHDNTSLDHVG